MDGRVIAWWGMVMNRDQVVESSLSLIEDTGGEDCSCSMVQVSTQCVEQTLSKTQIRDKKDYSLYCWITT